MCRCANKNLKWKLVVGGYVQVNYKVEEYVAGVGV